MREQSLQIQNVYLQIVTFLLACLLYFFFPMEPAHALEPSNIVSAVKKMEEHINTSVQKKQIPGCAVAVVYRNEIIFLKGFGVRAMGKEDMIDADTIFQLGSVSKPISATLAAVLEQTGAINFDAPVTDYLPNFRLKGRQEPSALKVKNILSHTSGLSRAGFNDMIESYKPYDDIVHKLQTTSPLTAVGKRYDYHNAVFSLIADIIKAATHESFQEALKTHLLKPLNMNRTSATLADLMSTDNRSYPHIKNRKGALCACVPYSDSYYAVAPAGGINSTARDMATFLKAQMGGYPNVVNAAARSRIQTPYIPTKNQLNFYPGAATRVKNAHYGMGWRIVDFADHKLVYHGGWLRGYTNFIAFMPDEQLGIVVLHNSDSRFSGKIALKFFELALGLPELHAEKVSKKKSLKAKNKSAKTEKKAAKEKKTAKKVKKLKKSKNAKKNKSKQ